MVFATLCLAALGFAYARWFLHTPWWSVAIATLGGALFGAIVATVPGQLLTFLRLHWLDFLIGHSEAVLAGALHKARDQIQKRLKDDGDSAELRALMGVSYLLAEEDGPAAEELRAALTAAEGSTAPAVCNNLGVAYALSGRTAPAAATFVQAAQSGSEEAVFNLANLYHLDGATVETKAAALLSDCDSALAHNNRGVYALHRGDLQTARDSLVRALETNPGYASAKSNLALVDFREGDVGRALDGAATAAALAPLSTKAQLNLGVLLLITGNLQAGRDTLRRAAALSPGVDRVHVALGLAYLAYREWDAALRQFREAISLNDRNLAAWHNAALTHFEVREFGAALADQKTALELGRDRASVHINMGCYYWETGERKQAAECFAQALKVQPDNSEAARNYALALTFSDRADEGVQILEHLQKERPQDAAVLFGLGLARLIAALSNYGPDMHPRDRQIMYTELYKAFRLFEAAQNRSEKPSAEITVNLALYHYLRMEYEEAEQHFEAALRVLGDRPEIHFALGCTHADHATHLRKEHDAPVDGLPPEARDHLRAAMRAFKAAYELDPGFNDAICNCGMVAYQLDDFETAVQAFRKLIHQEGSVEAHNALALVHAKRAKTLQTSARAVTLTTDTKRDEMRREALRLLTTAINCFKEAVSRDNRNPILHNNIGLAYLFRNQEDDVQSALAHWQMMRRVGGAWGERQYEIMSGLMEAKEHAKAEYNDTEMALRPLDPRRVAMSVSPVPAGPIFVFDDTYDTSDWAIATDSSLFRRALAQRARITRYRQRKAALQM